MAIYAWLHGYMVIYAWLRARGYMAKMVLPRNWQRKLRDPFSSHCYVDFRYIISFVFHRIIVNKRPHDIPYMPSAPLLIPNTLSH